jgi:uncharacterized membrane protein
MLGRIFPLLCVCLLGILYVTKPTLNKASELDVDTIYVRGSVVAVHEATTTTDGLSSHILSVSYENATAGTLLTRIPYEYRTSDTARKLDVGTQVIVGMPRADNGTNELFIADTYRLHSMYILLGGFVVITILCAGIGGGLRSFAGLLMASGVVWWYIIPGIASGGDPFTVSLIGTILIAGTSLYLAHGISASSTIALASISITATISAVLSHYSVSLMQLSGMGSEDALFLDIAPGMSINTAGLLMGGILLGALGVLDDITTAQASAVGEIRRANPLLSAQELFTRGMRVGREHILSLVNTLVLAYAGASFPLLLLLYVYERPLWVVINSEILMEEIVRTLVGSTALILAVPITTALAAWYAGKHPYESTPHTHG